jgi:hypothetical protein
MSMSTDRPFQTFGDFYRFYLTEHTHRTSRRLHFVGTSIALAVLMASVLWRVWWLAVIALVPGYLLAWIGHFFFERNRPATFKYPWLSLRGDLRLWWEILRGRIRF